MELVAAIHAKTKKEQLSRTNVYIYNLPQHCQDEDLKMCQYHGRILSAKAIVDKATFLCKGYGFVNFESSHDACKAVKALQATGIAAKFAGYLIEKMSWILLTSI